MIASKESVWPGQDFKQSNNFLSMGVNKVCLDEKGKPMPG
jgi:hypothetical protein